jgi:hypothetical protein
MCISVHPSEMSSTKVYAGEAERDGAYVHVLAYKNRARSLRTGGNAMTLPIPARSLGRENAVDATGFPSFIDDIADATRYRSRGLSRGVGPACAGGSAEIFNVGSYTVVLSDSAAAIEDAMIQVPVERRPRSNPAVTDFLVRAYPGWPIAVCCWSGSVDPEPLLWWYEPLDPSSIFVPTLDSHDGGAPRPGPVEADHYLCFGSTIRPQGLEPVRWSERIPDAAAQLLPRRAVATALRRTLPNGDVRLPVESLRKDLSPGSPPGPASRTFPSGDPADPPERFVQRYAKDLKAGGMPLGEALAQARRVQEASSIEVGFGVH